MRDPVEVAVVGGGFGGTLTAMCLAAQGRDVVVLERGRHPRFAIGESSTPLANWVLRDLCDRYGLDELRPLTKYGTWKAAHPEIGVGPKRGFSFFQHRAGKRYQPGPERGSELLVAANPSEQEADTQWLRSDVDAFFAANARARGVDVLEGVEVVSAERGPEGWRLGLRDGAGERALDARYVIDASGGGASPVTASLDLADDWSSLRTRSRTLYTHFEEVRPWEEVYRATGGDSAPHPFPADDAALHHVLPEGWMWFLRFDHGVTSVGMVLSTAEAGVSPEEEWSRVLGRYPSVAAQLEAAVPTRPLVRTGLLQRRLRPAAGPDWALLPAAAYFVDPFLSPGNAHGLFGIERIARAFERWPDDAEVARGLEEYDVALQREIDFLDALIHGSYRAFPSWPVLCAYTMYYFAGAICSEVRRERGEARPEDGFLFSHDDTFRELVHAAHRDVCALMAEGAPDGDSVEAFVERVRSDIEPFNLAGLCDPARTNLYPYV